MFSYESPNERSKSFFLKPFFFFYKVLKNKIFLLKIGSAIFDEGTTVERAAARHVAAGR